MTSEALVRLEQYIAAWRPEHPTEDIRALLDALDAAEDRVAALEMALRDLLATLQEPPSLRLKGQHPTSANAAYSRVGYVEAVLAARAALERTKDD